MTNTQGKYVVVEGLDGSGKTTQAKLLESRLASEGYHAYSTAEPTKGPVGKLIRKMLSGELKINKQVMGMLFIPDTLDHFTRDNNGLLAMIDYGTIVISDRSYFSTFAYQSAYIPLDWLLYGHSLSMSLMKPDLVIFLDATPKVCFQRLIDRGASLQMHEKLEFLEGVSTRYFEVFSKLRETIHIEMFDGHGTVEEIAAQIWEKVLPVVKG